ncbi:hypothetical protein Tco_1159479 [Tanacetum coccineum]
MRSPFVYLGTKVGGNMARVSEWKEVIDKNLEAIRSRFFHGHEMGSNQMSWVRWNLGPSTAKSKVVRWLPSLYALNRGMLMKWIWRFIVQPDCLWSRVIKAIHGNEGGIGCRSKFKSQSNWLSIIEEAASLKEKGINFFEFCPRGGTEAKQMEGLVDLVNSVELRPCEDRFVWNLDNSGEFSVSSIRKYIDNVRMPGSEVADDLDQKYPK